MLGGQKRELPAPRLASGVDTDEERRILLAIVGSPAILRDFLQDAKVATTIMRSHDVKGEKGTVCIRDLYFVIYSELGDVDKNAGPFGNNANKQAFDEGGIKVVSERVDNRRPRITAESPCKMGNESPRSMSTRRAISLEMCWCESTNHVLATGDDESWIVAFRTDSSV